MTPSDLSSVHETALREALTVAVLSQAEVSAHYSRWDEARDAILEAVRPLLVALEQEKAEIRSEWDSATSREASTFAELKKRREEIVTLRRHLSEALRTFRSRPPEQGNHYNVYPVNGLISAIETVLAQWETP